MSAIPIAVRVVCGFGSPMTQLVIAVKMNVRVVMTGIATDNSARKGSSVQRLLGDVITFDHLLVLVLGHIY